jgi:hypothetical protein
MNELLYGLQLEIVLAFFTGIFRHGGMKVLSFASLSSQSLGGLRSLGGFKLSQKNFTPLPRFSSHQHQICHFVAQHGLHKKPSNSLAVQSDLF